MTKLYIDIGGTYLRSELVVGANLIKETVSSQAQGLLSYINHMVLKHPDIDFIGISYAGQVYDGRILFAPNINVDETNIKETVLSRYGKRLEIDNDLNCAVMAEAQYWQSSSVAALYVGTGIGAAVIDTGSLVRGSRNLSFEIGHIPYRSAPFLCGCGRDNCIELFASGSGMGKWLHHYGSDQCINLEQLKNSKIEHEQFVATEFEIALLHAAGTLVTLANPEFLVLGGGIVEKNPYLLGYLKKYLQLYALAPSLKTLRIELSQLKNGPLLGTKLLEEKYYG
ncbi:MAG: ROK family protein [Sulfuricurvum sp.]|nr:ROK family protein [Sulfuricurvum sp.]